MDIVWIIVLVLLIYFAIVVSISAIRALLTKNRKNFAKEAFKETFWDLFLELINPFNWF